ncbi:MAG: TfoX/Sxy family protein [Actinobacteria bacterium]|nr:MAG: TfoX/Sxy family protein [Actinomycetota bacterium]
MVQALFDRVSERLLGEDAELERTRMFSSEGLKTAGKFFAMVSRGELVVKLPRERVDELVAAGAGHRFDPGHGRLMKEWVALRPADEPACAAYMGEARSFVGARANGS